MASVEKPLKKGELAKRLSPPRQASLPKVVRSGLSRLKSMGIAVILTDFAASRTVVGLSAMAGATGIIETAPNATAIVWRQTLSDRKHNATLIQLAALGPRTAGGGTIEVTPGKIFVEQFGELVSHHAGKLFGVGHGHRAPVVAGHVMADADCHEFDRRAGLDFLDHLAEMALKI